MARKKDKKLDKIDSNKKPKNKFGKTLYAILVLTAFCISFSSTAYIIINANKLTFKPQAMEKSVTEEIEALKTAIVEKDALIEELSLKAAAKGGSNAFSSPGYNSKSASTPTPSPTPKK